VEDFCTALNLHAIVQSLFFYWCSEPGSSVSMVSGYGLDDRAIEVPSPAEAKDFSCSLCVQTGSGAHPSSFTMGTGGPFHGDKRGRSVTLTTHPHVVPRSRMSRSYTSPPSALVACIVTVLALALPVYSCRCIENWRLFTFFHTDRNYLSLAVKLTWYTRTIFYYDWASCMAFRRP
jgi:hypothetical protein